MGQDIKYIITTEALKVPIYIVHFKEKNATVFPILMEDGDFSGMCEEAVESTETVTEFFNSVLYGGFNAEFPTKRLMSFIQFSELTSLAIIGYREICDMPLNLGLPVLFSKNKIVDLAKMNLDTEGKILENEVHKMMNAEILFTDIINNEDRYWSYENAEISYLNMLKNGR